MKQFPKIALALVGSVSALVACTQTGGGSGAPASGAGESGETDETAQAPAISAVEQKKADYERVIAQIPDIVSRIPQNVWHSGADRQLLLDEEQYGAIYGNIRSCWFWERDEESPCSMRAILGVFPQKDGKTLVLYKWLSECEGEWDVKANKVYVYDPEDKSLSETSMPWVAPTVKSITRGFVRYDDDEEWLEDICKHQKYPFNSSYFDEDSGDYMPELIDVEISTPGFWTNVHYKWDGERFELFDSYKWAAQFKDVILSKISNWPSSISKEQLKADLAWPAQFSADGVKGGNGTSERVNVSLYPCADSTVVAILTVATSTKLYAHVEDLRVFRYSPKDGNFMKLNEIPFLEEDNTEFDYLALTDFPQDKVEQVVADKSSYYYGPVGRMMYVKMDGGPDMCNRFPASLFCWQENTGKFEWRHDDRARCIGSPDGTIGFAGFKIGGKMPESIPGYQIVPVADGPCESYVEVRDKSGDLKLTVYLAGDREAETCDMTIKRIEIHSSNYGTYDEPELFVGMPIKDVINSGKFSFERLTRVGTECELDLKNPVNMTLTFTCEDCDKSQIPEGANETFNASAIGTTFVNTIYVCEKR